MLDKLKQKIKEINKFIDENTLTDKCSICFKCKKITDCKYLKYALKIIPDRVIVECKHFEQQDN